jgi:hypothetical protein
MPRRQTRSRRHRGHFALSKPSRKTTRRLIAAAIPAAIAIGSAYAYKKHTKSKKQKDYEGLRAFLNKRRDDDIKAVKLDNMYKQKAAEKCSHEGIYIPTYGCVTKQRFHELKKAYKAKGMKEMEDVMDEYEKLDEYNEYEDAEGSTEYDGHFINPISAAMDSELRKCVMELKGEAKDLASIIRLKNDPRVLKCAFKAARHLNNEKVAAMATLVKDMV